MLCTRGIVLHFSLFVGNVASAAFDKLICRETMMARRAWHRLGTTRTTTTTTTTAAMATTSRRMECVQSSARQRTLHRVNVSPSWIACSVHPCSLSPLLQPLFHPLTLSLFPPTDVFPSLSVFVTFAYLTIRLSGRLSTRSILPDDIGV